MLSSNISWCNISMMASQANEQNCSTLNLLDQSILHLWPLLSTDSVFLGAAAVQANCMLPLTGILYCCTFWKRIETSQRQNHGKLLDQHANGNKDLHWWEIMVKMVCTRSNLKIKVGKKATWFWSALWPSQYDTQRFSLKKKLTHHPSTSSPERRMWSSRRYNYPLGTCWKAHWLDDDKNQESLIQLSEQQ